MGVKVRERPKGSGVWWIFIDHQGKRKAKKIGRDEDLAQDVAKKIEAKLVLGEFGILKPEKPETPCFKDYANIWLESYIKTLRRPATYERYQGVLKQHVYPAIGKISIDEIKRGDVRKLLLKLYDGKLSKSSVCLVRDVISGPMSQAVDEELIAANPVTGLVKRMNLERDKRSRIEPFTSEEVSQFLNTCAENYAEYYPFFLCAFRTGMRLGEILALKWGDVDWNGKFLEVRRSYKRGHVTPTKTGKMRRVDMSDQLIETLRGLNLRRKREALKDGHGEIVEFVFHRNEKPMEQNYIRRVFKRILSKVGLREIRFHDIRPTFASLLLSDGASPVYVKEQLGHASIQMTVDIYGHLIPSSNREMVNRLDTQQSVTPAQPAAQPEKHQGEFIQ
jgi:integrase